MEYLKQDARIIAHLMEFGASNRKHIAVLCGADEKNLEPKLDSIRKRLKLLMEVSPIDDDENQSVKGKKLETGLIRTVGKETGHHTVYELTPLGEHFYNSSKIPHKFDTQDSEQKRFNVTSVVVRMSGARESSWFKELAPGESSVGLPIISASRIAYSTEVMLKSMTESTGMKPIHRQSLDAEFWRKDSSYPSVLGRSMDVANLTAEESNKIRDYFKTPRTEVVNGRRFSVLPPYLFQIFDDEGTPLNLMDFVIPLPHLVDKGKSSQCVIAGFIDYDLPADDLERDTLLQERFLRLANSNIPYSTIACFIKRSDDAALKDIETNWQTLIDHGLIDQRQANCLQVIPYDPICAPSEHDDFATSDAGKMGSHYARG